MGKEVEQENRDFDWRKIVEQAYLGIIQGSLNRIAVFGHDTILNNIIRLVVSVDTGVKKKIKMQMKFW